MPGPVPSTVGTRKWRATATATTNPVGATTAIHRRRRRSTKGCSKNLPASFTIARCPSNGRTPKGQFVERVFPTQMGSRSLLAPGPGGYERLFRAAFGRSSTQPLRLILEISEELGVSDLSNLALLLNLVNLDAELL